MPTVADNDLKELKDLITAGFSRIDAEITDLKVNQARRSEQGNRTHILTKKKLKMKNNLTKKE